MSLHPNSPAAQAEAKRVASIAKVPSVAAAIAAAPKEIVTQALPTTTFVSVSPVLTVQTRVGAIVFVPQANTPNGVYTTNNPTIIEDIKNAKFRVPSLFLS